MDRTRPEWVQTSNAGGIVALDDVARLPLTARSLIDEVALRRGERPRDLPSLGDDVTEPLDVLCTALESEAELHLLGRWMTRRFLLRLLEARQQIAELVADEATIAQEHIVEPIVITGPPRSGTTLLHSLMAADDRHRAPEGWELLYPAPGSDPDAVTDTRVQLAADELSLPQRIVEGVTTMHRYSGRMLKECLSAMSFSFRSEEFVARYRVPSYADWLAGADMQPAYDWHRCVLQILQRGRPQHRWVLKSPVHLGSLDEVYETYPDVRVIVTHRDPIAVLASVTDLVAALRYAHSDTVDERDIAADHADLYAARLGAFTDRTLPPGRHVHLYHGDIMRSGADAAARAYGRLGLALDDATRSGWERVVGSNVRDGPPTWRITPDLEAQRERFARYVERFGVER